MTLGLSSLHVQMSHGFCYIHDNTVLLFLKTEVITDISASLYLFGEAKAREFTRSDRYLQHYHLCCYSAAVVVSFTHNCLQTACSNR